MSFIGFEVTTIVDGKLISHPATSWEDALEWAACYPVNFTDAGVRIWKTVTLLGVVVWSKLEAVSQHKV